MQPTDEEQEEDEDFDFGKAKMDFFKKRARDILMSEADMEYVGNPMPLSGAYKNLKHAIKNPASTMTKLDEKPAYMKMTFAMSRHAPAAAKHLEIGKQADIAKSAKNLQPLGLNPLLLSKKDQAQLVGATKGSKPDTKFLDAVFGKEKYLAQKEKTRDKKVEALLQAYKKQDEELTRKEYEKDNTKKLNQKALLDKFGFSDEEEDQNLQDAMGGKRGLSKAN